MTFDENIANDTPVSHGPDDDRAPYEVALERIRVLENQIDIIQMKLLNEATDRGWCDDYDSFCKDVNSMLGEAVLTPCVREYSAQFSVRFEWEARGAVVNVSDMERAIYSTLNAHFPWPDGVEDNSIGVSRD